MHRHQIVLCHLLRSAQLGCDLCCAQQDLFNMVLRMHEKGGVRMESKLQGL